MDKAKGNDNSLPCDNGVDCPYDYDNSSGRDIEGMPFIDDDPRECPIYGHICPKFMEALGLTIEDLNIRAVIHCGRLAELSYKSSKDKPSEGELKLINKYKDFLKKYPSEKYPKYY